MKKFSYLGQVVCRRLPLFIERSIRKLIKKFFIFLLTNCQNYVIIIVFSKGKQNIFKGRKFILAGGLNASNVEEGIRLFEPDAVDVSSGVESTGGKDRNLIKEFTGKVKGYE